MTNTLKNLTLKVWRQDGPNTSGAFETHTIEEITDEASFLEMIDILNERLIDCLLYTSPSPRDQRGSRMPSSA